MNITIDTTKVVKTIWNWLFVIVVLVGIGLFAWNTYNAYFPKERGSDAFIYGLNEENLEARAPYTSLPMFECAWCHRTYKLNRHHIVPQSADPTKIHDLSNIIILCRDCHFVLGHRCDWKKFNPDVQAITRNYTNCVVSKTYFESIVSNVNQKIEMQNAEYTNEIAYTGTVITNFVAKDMKNLKISREDFETEEEWAEATNKIANIASGKIDDSKFEPKVYKEAREEVDLPHPPTEEKTQLDYVPPPAAF